MYCVIQETVRKKPDPYGEYKEIRAYPLEMSINGVKQVPVWRWEWTGGRFERPHMEKFKISLHESFRESGKVKKRQYAVCTMSYYDICESWWGDCIVGGETALADKLGIDTAELYRIIDTKLEPLRKRLEAEFHQSPEYIARQEHERIRADYMTAQTEFCSRYDVDKDEFARCYDIFLTLRNKEYLEKIKADHKARKASESSYQEYFRSSYSGWSGGSYSIPSTSTYTEEETDMLRQFYKALAKKYHPDLNPERDTTREMQLLNRLKDTWGV